MKVPPSYEIFTFPPPPASKRPIMLAACPGGPGMSYGYLRDLVMPYPSLGIDWLRVNSKGLPLHKRDIHLDAQVAFLEICRQRASQEIGQDIKLIPICHSAGAPRGILWAARYPEHVAGLVLIDAMVTAPPLPYSSGKVLLDVARYWCLHPRSGLESAFRARFVEVVGEYYFVQPTPEHKQAFRQTFVSPFLPLLQESGFLTWDAQAALTTLQAPVLFIHGTEDRLIAPESARQHREQVGDRATICFIQGTGHLPMIEQPQQTAEALRAFLFDVAEFRLP